MECDARQGILPHPPDLPQADIDDRHGSQKCQQESPEAVFEQHPSQDIKAEQLQESLREQQPGIRQPIIAGQTIQEADNGDVDGGVNADIVGIAQRRVVLEPVRVVEGSRVTGDIAAIAGEDDHRVVALQTAQEI